MECRDDIASVSIILLPIGQPKNIGTPGGMGSLINGSVDFLSRFFFCGCAAVEVRELQVPRGAYYSDTLRHYSENVLASTNLSALAQLSTASSTHRSWSASVPKKLLHNLQHQHVSGEGSYPS